MSEIDDLLNGAIRDFKEAKEKLTAAQRKLEEYAEGTATNVDPAIQLHSTIGCVIVDSLEPALRDLDKLNSSGVFPPEIRPAGLQDFEAIYTILKTPDIERSDRSLPIPGDLEQSLREPHGVFLVAEDSGTIVGFIYAVQDTSTKAILRYLVVVPQLRRLGIASRLLSDCMTALARERGIKEVGAFVRPETFTLPFLKKRQFRLGDSFTWMARDITKIAESDTREKE